MALLAETERDERLQLCEGGRRGGSFHDNTKACLLRECVLIKKHKRERNRQSNLPNLRCAKPRFCEGRGGVDKVMTFLAETERDERLQLCEEEWEEAVSITIPKHVCCVSACSLKSTSANATDDRKPSCIVF